MLIYVLSVVIAVKKTSGSEGGLTRPSTLHKDLLTGTPPPTASPLTAGTSKPPTASMYMFLSYHCLFEIV